MKFFVLTLLILGLTQTQSTPVAKKVEKRTTLDSSKADISPKAWNLKDESLKSKNSQSLIPKFKNSKFEKDEIKNENKDLKEDELRPENDSEKEEVDREKKSCKTVKSLPVPPTKIYLELTPSPCEMEICEDDPPVPEILPAVSPAQIIQMPPAQPPVYFCQMPPPPPPTQPICYDPVLQPQIQYLPLPSTQVYSHGTIMKVQPHRNLKIVHPTRVHGISEKHWHLTDCVSEGQSQDDLNSHLNQPDTKSSPQDEIKLTGCTCTSSNPTSASKVTKEMVSISNLHPSGAFSMFRNAGDLTLHQPAIATNQPAVAVHQPSIAVHHPSMMVHHPSMMVHHSPMMVQQQSRILPFQISRQARAMDASRDPLVDQGQRHSRGSETATIQHEHAHQAYKNSQTQNSESEDQLATEKSLSSQTMFPQISLMSDKTKINEDNLNMRNYEIQHKRKQSFMNEEFENMGGM